MVRFLAFDICKNIKKWKEIFHNRIECSYERKKYVYVQKTKQKNRKKSEGYCHWRWLNGDIYCRLLSRYYAYSAMHFPITHFFIDHYFISSSERMQIRRWMPLHIGFGGKIFSRKSYIDSSNSWSSKWSHWNPLCWSVCDGFSMQKKKVRGCIIHSPIPMFPLYCSQ
jgi:hypothetical protein